MPTIVDPDVGPVTVHPLSPEMLAAIRFDVERALHEDVALEVDAEPEADGLTPRQKARAVLWQHFLVRAAVVAPTPPALDVPPLTAATPLIDVGREGWTAGAISRLATDILALSTKAAA